MTASDLYAGSGFAFCSGLGAWLTPILLALYLAALIWAALLVRRRGLIEGAQAAFGPAILFISTLGADWIHGMILMPGRYTQIGTIQALMDPACSIF